jgi:hypothetical protein
MRPWPGGGSAPAKPVAGGQAEVTLAGRGRGGSNAFLGGALGRRKQQAYVLITWPGGGSVSRTVKGNMTIRYVMQWAAEFNQECARLSAGDAVRRGGILRLAGSGGGADVEVVVIDSVGNRTTEHINTHMAEQHGIPPSPQGDPAALAWLHREAPVRCRPGHEHSHPREQQAS